ncbi:hypothetical protein ACFV80_15175 [Streptomyces sp. NPDC059862]|uniref:hypothetical protein n=1 Tax=Streptomyces sp. NPDC059862 TaxID=3346975 RepID=UPI003659DFE8
MNAPRARRLLALSAIGVLMAGGAAIGTAGTASAATPATTATVPTNWGDDCDWWGDCHRFGDRFGDRFGFFNGFDHFDRFDRFGGGPVVIVVG